MKLFKAIVFIQILSIHVAIPLHSQDAFFLKENPVSRTLRGVSINGVDQSADGFIWLGTSEGLYRFDGHDCLPVWLLIGTESPLLRLPVAAVHASDPASIYVSVEGGGVYRLNSLSFSFSEIPISRPALGTGLEGIIDFAISNDSKLFARQSGGGLLLKATNGESFVSASVRDYPSAMALESPSYGIDPGDGTVWLRLSEQEYLQIDRTDGSLLTASDGNAVSDQNISWSDSWCMQAHDDSYWVSIWGVGLYRYSREEGMVSVLTGGLYPLAAVTDSEGFLGVVQSDGRIIRLDPKAFEIEVLYEVADSELVAATKLNVDGNGLIWITDGHSVFKLVKEETTISFYEIPGGAAIATVNGIDAYDASNVMVASEAGLYRLGMNGGYQQLTLRSQCLSAVRMTEGTIFASTANGFLRIDNDGGVDVIRDFLQVKDIAMDSGGVMWLAAIAEGVDEYDREQENLRFWNVEMPREEYLRSLDAVTILEARNGSIWAGTSGTGLLGILPNRQHYTRITQEQGLLSNRVSHISEGSAGKLWVSSAQGLSKYDPEMDAIENFSTAEGLPAAGVLAALEDGKGFVWLSTSAGLYRYDQENMVAVQMVELSGTDSRLFTTGAAFAGPDGALFFGATNGVYQVQNPNAPKEQRTAAELVITAIQTSDRGEVPVSSVVDAGEFRIGYENNSFRIEFALLDYAEPEKNAYRYFLEGVDSATVTGAGKGVAEYARLPPGTYSFVYSAADRSGKWLADKSIRLVVVPPFWMTTEFRLFAGLVLMLVLFGAYKIRTNAIKAQRNALQREVDERRVAQGQLLSYQHRLRQLAARLTIAEEVERRRIAGILHDHIGQALMMSKAKLDKYDHDKDNGMDAELKKVSELVRRAIKETRSLTVEVSPPSLHKFGLEAALESLVDKMSDDHGIEIIMERNQDTGLSDDISVLIYQSTRELLFNVIKHAEASRVHVHVGNRAGEFILTVRDNGRGFNVDAVMARAEEEMGYGLFSIRERMESIGGKMHVNSTPGKGTSIELVVPLQK